MDVNLTVGQLVCSTSGRDKDRLYLVYGSAEGNRLLLVDGDKRRLENPKKKNIKHVKVLPYISETVKEKIELQKQITDEDIKNAIEEYREQNEKECLPREG